MLLLSSAFPSAVSAQTVLFNAHKDYASGMGPSAIAVGDLNGDSVPDVVTTNGGDKSLAALLGNGDGTFQPPRVTLPAPNVERGPSSVAIGDFNGDGKPDVVTNIAPDNGNNVSVLLGNGDGTFQAARTFDVGSQPFVVAVDDFNGDGRADLAVTNRGTRPSYPGNVAVLVGNGDGTFQAARNFRVGNLPYGVKVADFNRDGKRDLVVANTDSKNVSLLLGNGDGTFQAPQLIIGAHPASVSVADFNGDGVPDLLVNVYYRHYVLLGSGDGTFPTRREVFDVSGAVAGPAGDFNGDGVLDLVVAGYIGSVLRMWVRLGNGDGTFQTARTFAGGSYGSGAVAVADFNRDGVVDLAVANGSFTKTVSVLLGNGDGTFPATPAFGVGISPQSVAVGDFDRDDSLDLAVANAGSNSVSVLMGTSDGTFQAEHTYPAGEGPTSVAVGDFNRDGNRDLVVANYGSNDYYALTVATTVSVLLGNGDGTFGAPQTFEAGSGPHSVAVGDFNGDSKQDLAVADYGPPPQRAATVSVLLGNGDGTFSTAQPFEAGNGVTSVAVGDFNRDGVQDLAVSNANDNTVSVLTGNGDGTFQAARSFGVGSFPWFVVVGDFNGDQAQDLAVSAQMDDAVSVLLGEGNGSFRPVLTFPTGPSPAGVAIGDFDADGAQDLAVANGLATAVSVLVGKRDGTFLPAESFGVGIAPVSVAVGDFNVDGRPDLAVANYFSRWALSSVSVLTSPPNVARPAFSPPEGTYVESQTVTLSVTTSDAPIHYTTDATTPTSASPVYAAPIVITHTTTIRAMAAARGMYDSDVVTATYTIRAAPPIFSLANGTYDQPQSVALRTTTGGATMYYTTDGSTPTTSSAIYTGPIAVTRTTTIQAMAAAIGMIASDVSSAAFTLQAAAPAFNPPGGSYRHPQRISISDASPGTTIYYTTDGTTPTTASRQYTRPFVVPRTATIRAIAVAAGWSQSDVADAAYTITPGPPGEFPR
jgi:hypothetical protein